MNSYYLYINRQFKKKEFCGNEIDIAFKYIMEPENIKKISELKKWHVSKIK